MPYINEEKRKILDKYIDDIVFHFKCSVEKTCLDTLNEEQFMQTLGCINYYFSRVLSSLMGAASYNKIAMITGVLENIKQEFYRRVASPYENQKINQNGDIKEYQILK